MIVKIGSFNEDTDFSAGDAWIPLREFSVKYFQVAAIPIGAISLASFTFFWLFYTPVLNCFEKTTFPLLILQNLTILIGVIIAHEMIHVLFHPRSGFSKRSVIQIWPEKLFVCTYYLGEISRARSIVIQIMPFTILSIIPLIIAIVAQISPIWFAYMSIVNALVACGDLLAIVLTLRELPNGAIIRSTGWNGFYRLREEQTESITRSKNGNLTGRSS